MLTSIQRRMSEYVTTVRESNYNSFFKIEFADSEQKKNVAEISLEIFKMFGRRKHM